ncbi:MAG: Ig-like domain-containing protein [Gemmatimonadetes bacterium]|nr:Ig-like domain-containing protein [Gemmatimonadota bacterium]
MRADRSTLRPLRAWRRALTVGFTMAGLSLLAGCAVDSTEPGVLPTAAALDIRDGRNGGSPRFHFQPPIAPVTAYTGTFDPGARPLVWVTQWAPSGPIVAQFSDTSATRVVMEPGAEQYLVRWRTSTCNVGQCRMEPRRTYRVVVLSPITLAPYGWADVMLVRRAEELGAVPAGVVGVVFGQVLPIRFRIEKPRVARVTVQPVQAAIDLGRTQLLTAVATDSAGQVVPNIPVTWSSTAPSFAAVSTNGIATAVAPGSAVIQATMDGVTGFALITAQRAPALRIVPARAIVAVGQQLALAALDSTGAPASGVIWFAPDPAVAVVSANGMVTGLAPGVARIRALTNTAMYEALVTIQGPGPQVNVMPPRDSLVPGQVTHLVATDRDGAPIPHAQVLWLSTNSAVAVVSAQGVVTGIGSGTAAIQARVGALVGHATIVVVAPFSGVPPSPRQPTDSVRIRQDDPASGCTPGQGGFAFEFQWTPGAGSLPRLGDHFELTDGTGAVVIGTPTGVTPGMWWGACGFVVPDHRLDGWSWRVRTQFTDGSFTAWGPDAPFGFLPSTSSPNLTSFPLDYGAGKSQVSISGAVDAITADRVTISVDYKMPPNSFLPLQAFEFHRWVPPHAGSPAQSGFYRSLGAATTCLIRDNGTNRFFRCSRAWDPGPSDTTGTYPLVATVLDPGSGRFVGAFLDVTVVP